MGKRYALFLIISHAITITLVGIFRLVGLETVHIHQHHLNTMFLALAVQVIVGGQHLVTEASLQVVILVRLVLPVQLNEYGFHPGGLQVTHMGGDKKGNFLRRMVSVPKDHMVILLEHLLEKLAGANRHLVIADGDITDIALLGYVTMLNISNGTKSPYSQPKAGTQKPFGEP